MAVDTKLREDRIAWMKRILECDESFVTQIHELIELADANYNAGAYRTAELRLCARVESKAFRRYIRSFTKDQLANMLTDIVKAYLPDGSRCFVSEYFGIYKPGWLRKKYTFLAEVRLPTPPSNTLTV